MEEVTSQFNQAVSEKIENYYESYLGIKIDLSQIKLSMLALSEQDTIKNSKKVTFYYAVDAGDKSALIKTSMIELFSLSIAKQVYAVDRFGNTVSTNNIECESSMTVQSVDPNSLSTEIHLYTNTRDFLYNEYSGFQLTHEFTSLRIPMFIPKTNFFSYGNMTSNIISKD